MAKKKEKPQVSIEFPTLFRVIAADLSLKRPGFAKFICEQTESGLEISDIQLASVDNKTKPKPHGELLDDIMKGLAFFIPDDDIPTFHVREKAFNSRAAQSEIGIYKVVGIHDWFLYRMNKECYEIYPVTVKKAITGSGKADKQMVASALKYYVGELNFDNDDESDALAVGISFLITNNLLKGITDDGTKKNISV